MRHINERGKRAIIEHEGFKLKAYLDGGGVWTIGVGHTEGVKRGQVITEEQAWLMFDADLAEFEIGVDARVPLDLTSNQFSACVSLAFNIGVKAFNSSTLAKKLDRGDIDGAAYEFLRWNLDNGKPVRGLTLRRQDERLLFLTPDNPAVEPAPEATPEPPANTTTTTTVEQKTTLEQIGDIVHSDTVGKIVQSDPVKQIASQGVGTLGRGAARALAAGSVTSFLASFWEKNSTYILFAGFLILLAFAIWIAVMIHGHLKENKEANINSNKKLNDIKFLPKK